GHMFNDGRTAANLGFGSRFNLPSTWVIGGNFFYDFRDVKVLNSTSQISAGFEAFHQYFDFRLSGYYPVGSPRKSVKTNTDIKASIALPSIFGSLGFPIPTWDFMELYFAFGPYYLVERTKSDIDCGGSFGAFTRLSAKVYDGITIGVDGTFDGTFHAIAQGFIAITFPWGPAQLVKNDNRWRSWFPSSSCKSEALIRRRMQSAVWHNEIIPVCTGSRKR
ncbi:MAG TPA: inverse autotransporter beta domain-containing protein, partial [Chlamydiales bacterium]|nr:inverse autotransporter beta domain-containing protein [Chlamydiales bacterium]